MNEEKEIRELQKQIDALSKAQSPLVDRRNKIAEKLTLKKNQKLIGKCYSTKNFYNEKEPWTLYRKIVDASDWRLIVISVEADKQFGAEIKLQPMSPDFMKYGDEKEISPKAFEKAFNKVLKQIKEGKQ